MWRGQITHRCATLWTNENRSLKICFFKTKPCLVSETILHILHSQSLKSLLVKNINQILIFGLLHMDITGASEGFFLGGVALNAIFEKVIFVVITSLTLNTGNV